MKKLLAIAVFMMVSYQIFAVDKSIYYGSWGEKAGSDLLSLTLLKNNIIIKINGKKISQPVEYEYIYSKISPYPFLSIVFTDEQKTEHLIYLLIGDESKCNKTILSGFYEMTTLIENSDGKLTSSSRKIELVKIND